MQNPLCCPKICYSNSFLVGKGDVALIAGGKQDNVIAIDTVRLYTPDGGCIGELPGIPEPLVEPILVLLLNQIYLCFGYYPGAPIIKNQNCWKYFE